MHVLAVVHDDAGAVLAAGHDEVVDALDLHVVDGHGLIELERAHGAH